MGTRTSGAELRYTLDGSTPTAASLLYSAPWSVTTATVIKVLALKSGWNSSAVTTATFTFNYGTLAAPTFTPGPGTHRYNQQISLSAEAFATIRYTTDGSTPTGSSPIYATPFTLTGTTTINAKAFLRGTNGRCRQHPVLLVGRGAAPPIITSAII